MADHEEDDGCGRIGRSKVDLLSVANRTFTNRFRLDHYRRVLDDPERDARREAQQCVCCHYGGRIGGAMMTRQQCALCDEVMRFGSTSVDVLCLECARRHRLCRHCGADVEGKQRRKL